MFQNVSLDDFQEFVRQTLERWHVPGAAIAVIKDGEVILSQGFGLRNLENQLPVTAQTLFPIASCTKAFTAMLLALLVDEGKFDWDQPVRTYLPTFRLHDPVASERINGRDLLCHRSGLPRHDMMWAASNFTRQELFDRLCYLELSRDFRAAFQYNNNLYMVAGVLAGQIAGLGWEELVRQRIFEPLGMQRSNFSTAVTQQDDNFATPYQYRNEQLKQITFFETDGVNDPVGPCGNIVSSVEELAKWLLIHLNGGRLGDSQFVSQANLQQMHSPHIFIDDPVARERYGQEFTSYGLGWEMLSHKGELLIQHSGAIDGFASLVSFLPRHNVGVVVLSNSNANYNPIPAILSYEVYDRLAGLKPTDWNGLLQPLYDSGVAAQNAGKEKSDALRKTDAPLSHPIAAYLGEYEHVAYGLLRVQSASAEHDALQLVMNDKLTLPLTHYHYDIFEAYYEKWDEHFKVRFGIDLRGEIDSITMQVESAVKDITFARRADVMLRDPAILKQFVGVYNYEGFPHTVSFKDAVTLKLSIPGDMDRLLLPYRGTEFNVEGLSGFSVLFKQEEGATEGYYNQAVFTIPGAVFTAQRVE